MDSFLLTGSHFTVTDSSRLAGIPGSMPIRIKSLVKKPERLSLASYRPEMMKATSDALPT